MPNDRKYWRRYCQRYCLAAVLALCAVLLSSRAQAAASELTFLGIYEDGRHAERIEAAVRRRLELLEITVQQPSPRPGSVCQSAGCLAAAPGAALTGRILRASLGCVTTLWLHRPNAPVFEREIPCRTEWTQEELAMAVAGAAGGMFESGTPQLQAPVENSTATKSQFLTTKDPAVPRTDRMKWSTKRKVAIFGLSVLAVGTSIAAGYSISQSDATKDTSESNGRSIYSILAMGFWSASAVEITGVAALIFAPMKKL